MAKGLGKGLDAIFKGQEMVNGNQVEKIKVRSIKPNPFQPRKEFSDEALEELATSIKEHGVLQPIIVRKKGVSYEIVVGERRFRASKLALQNEIPAVVRDLTDQQMMEYALLENLQREDLNAIEEAEAYQNLMEHLSLTQEQLAQRLGKSRPYIANHIRLLSLPKEIQAYVVEGQLSTGHARALLALKNKKVMQQVAEKIIAEGLNVRQLEALVQQMMQSEGSKETKKELKKDLFIEEYEGHLRDYFGTSVQIKKGKHKGKIEIEFFSDDDLERILEMLK
ncbi:stage 0 sporulation protein J [Kurthia zopfii]|uniref:Chromosome segregation DNA-binding protein n=1 Tax=Kurthia zopfii TaxID=1650 RepID=A0A8B4QF08_9BACL|nr:ParB/RepB/Spo0J family partition protein [Kurthia zopfii]PWI21522.1 chromosome partitioning protein ParB [Kurthia zopfii]TDR34768.1 chromosome segregation DNA-binding protein [Kurthia zopfii]GEK31245.1 stage 0 sporulation protein J [Kurthia zopfii]STX11255.1 Probable chromosome-partitioning protein parB [Kurthia zopfii]